MTGSKTTIFQNAIVFSLSLVLCLAIAPFHIQAAEKQVWNFGSPNPTDVIATLENGKLSITGKGDTMRYPNVPWWNMPFTSFYMDPEVRPTSMSEWFRNSNLTEVPKIPDSVKEMDSAFPFCFWMTTPPELPEGLESAICSFYYCENLKTPPKIPKSVKNIRSMFFDCRSLTQFPEIPENVEFMGSAFFNCYELTGDLTIPDTVTEINGIFNGTKKAINMYYGASNTLARDVEVPSNVRKYVIDNIPPVISNVAVLNRTVTITANDNDRVVQYGYSQSNDETTVHNWQTQPTFRDLVDNQTYYAFAQDAKGNISSGYQFVIGVPDLEAPVIREIQISGASATIVAGDNIKVAQYSVSKTDDAASVANWQEENIFRLEIGQPYYAFAKDEDGNVSGAFQFSLGDTELPVVTRVRINAEKRNIQIYGQDNAGVVLYGYSRTEAASTVTKWNGSGIFLALPEGNYFAFVKDRAENISEAYPFTIGTPDIAAPMVTEVVCNGSKTEIIATDDKGVINYGVSPTADPSEVIVWKQSNIFTSLKMGTTYYAFARDAAENVSMPYQFVAGGEISDNTAPVVNSVVIEGTEVTIAASDNIGVEKYGVSTSNDSKDVIAWKASNKFVSLKNEGTYYAFAMDASGNISEPYAFDFGETKDTEAPVISRVRINGRNVQVYGTDNVAVEEYALSESNDYAANIKHNTSGIFTKLTAGTTYYAFAKDAAGNISTAYQFEIPAEALAEYSDEEVSYAEFEEI